MYKRSCSGINSTFIVWCADKVALQKDERKMELKAQSDQVSLIESKCMHELKNRFFFFMFNVYSRFEEIQHL